MTTLLKAVPPAQTPEGKAALSALWQKKWAAARKGTRNTRITGAVCFLASPFVLYLVGPNIWGGSIACVLFMGIVLIGDVARVDGLTKDEYYSVPGSRDKRDRHRCIYCGHRGIDTHHYGRSGMLKDVHCHKCKNHLY